MTLPTTFPNFPSRPVLIAEAKRRIRANWKRVLIGDLFNETDVLRANQLAWDIFLCGTIGAVSLLLICVGLLVPAPLRGIVWIGACLMLAAAVDRPSWEPFLCLPLIMTIVNAGAIGMAGLTASFPPDWIVYFVLRYGWIDAWSVAFMLRFAQPLIGLIVDVLGGASFAQLDEVDSIRDRLRANLHIRTRNTVIVTRVEQWLFKPHREYPAGTILMTFKTPGAESRLAEISELLQRPVSLTYTKKSHKPRLVIPPVEKGAPDASR